MKNIEVSKVIDPIPTSDGAGVKLKRSIGVEPDYFDPLKIKMIISLDFLPTPIEELKL